MMSERLVKLAAPADAARLQQLLERCSDYYELHEGCATPADAGEYELTLVPPMSTLDDLYVLALEDETGALQAMAQFVRNYPQSGIWWIGMLVVAPELRGQGLGAVLLRHVVETAAAEGAIDIRLAVAVNNPRAQSFWEAAGFRPTGETPAITARNGHVTVGRILSRAM